MSPAYLPNDVTLSEQQVFSHRRDVIEEFVFREQNAENVGGGVLERAIQCLVEETVAAGRVRKEAFHRRPLDVLLDKVSTADGTRVSANLRKQSSRSSFHCHQSVYYVSQ